MFRRPTATPETVATLNADLAQLRSELDEATQSHARACLDEANGVPDAAKTVKQAERDISRLRDSISRKESALTLAQTALTAADAKEQAKATAARWAEVDALTDRANTLADVAAQRIEALAEVLRELIPLGRQISKVAPRLEVPITMSPFSEGKLAAAVRDEFARHGIDFDRPALEAAPAVSMPLVERVKAAFRFATKMKDAA